MLLLFPSIVAYKLYVNINCYCFRYNLLCSYTLKKIIIDLSVLICLIAG